MYNKYYLSKESRLDSQTLILITQNQLLDESERIKNCPNIPDSNFIEVWVDEIDMYIRDDRRYAYNAAILYLERPGFYR